MRLRSCGGYGISLPTGRPRFCEGPQLAAGTEIAKQRPTVFHQRSTTADKAPTWHQSSRNSARLGFKLVAREATASCLCTRRGCPLRGKSQSQTRTAPQPSSTLDSKTARCILVSTARSGRESFYDEELSIRPPHFATIFPWSHHAFKRPHAAVRPAIHRPLIELQRVEFLPSGFLPPQPPSPPRAIPNRRTSHELQWYFPPALPTPNLNETGSVFGFFRNEAQTSPLQPDRARWVTSVLWVPRANRCCSARLGGSASRPAVQKPACAR